MRLFRDERGQAIQVGAAILLAFVVLAITAYQVQVVPDQNAEIEFDHNQVVQDDLQDVRNDVVRTVGGGSGGSQSVELGTTYPARTIFVNPGPAAGQLRTVEFEEPIRIENANATEEAAETRTFWDGSDWERNTSSFVYGPGYSVYRSAPTTIHEHSLLYNRHPNAGNRSVADQILIEDDEITLVTLRGDLSESSTGSESVRTRALSTSSNTVSVEGQGSDPIEIVLPTSDPAIWDEQIDETETETVESVDPDPTSGTVRIVLNDSREYTLRMAEVGVGLVDRAAPHERAAYIAQLDTSAETAVVEVRDELNNPVRNLEVDVDVEGTTTTRSTGSNGQVEIGPLSPGDDVEVEVASDPTVDTAFTVSGGAGGGTYSLAWNTTSIDDQSGIACGSDCTYQLSEDEVNLTVETSPAISGATVDYALEGDANATVDPGTGETDSEGRNTTVLNGSEADPGDEVTVHANAASDGDTLLVRFADGPFYDVTIDGTNSPVDEGETLTVDATIDNVGNEDDTQTIELEIDGDVKDSQSVPLTAGDSQSITLEWSTGSGDAGDYTATVNSENDTDTASVSVETGSDTDPPELTSLTVQNAPLNQSDTGDTHTVTLSFDEAMDTTVDPTVELSDLESRGSYNTNLANNGVWTDSQTWESEFTLNDDDEDVVSTIAVSDAEDEAGNAMTEDTSNTVTVDTIRPNDPDEVRIVTDPINVSNENAVDVEVDVDGPDADGGTVFVRLADNDGNTVTASGAMATGSGTVTTTITGIDVSSLNDADPDAAGGITATARLVDDVNNENPSGFTTQSDEVLKDTVPPTIERFELTNPTGSEFRVELDADETLSAISVDVEDSDGNLVTTLTRSDFSETCNAGTCTYAAQEPVTENDLYTAVLNVAEDDAGNDGSSGETDTARVFDYSNQLFEPVEMRDSGNRLVFRFDNTGSSQVTIEQFEVDATGVGSGITIDDGNAEELEITRVQQNGVANRNGNPFNYNADGTRYDLVADSNKGNDGQYAEVGPNDDDAEADFRTFSQDLGTLAFTDTVADADVSVTFVLSDGSEQQFYFEQV